MDKANHVTSGRRDVSTDSNRIHAGLLALWVVAATAAPAVWAAEVPFAEQTVDEAFDGARSVSVADLDGDGDLDVLGAAYDAHSVVWWENTAGDGSAWTEHTVDSAFGGAHSVSPADVDGDGDLDLLGAAAVDNAISWFENTAGDGSAWTQHTVAAAGTFNSARAVSSADVDGDGDLDILGAAFVDDDIVWFENSAGDGSSWIRHTVAGAFNGAYSVSSADVDGDGDVDILGAALVDDDIAWFENTAGDGSAWTEHTIAGAFDGAQSVSSADVDGDGDVDVLGAANTDDDIAWWENTTGDGSSWTEHIVANAFDGARSVSSADVDGDGDVDILGAANQAGEISWFENTAGDGSAWTEYTLTGAFADAYSVTSADVDGDGDVDILGAANQADVIGWWENETIHRSAVYPIEHTVDDSFGDVTEVSWADVDGDGDIDLLATSVMVGHIAWWENTAGDGSAWTQHTVDGVLTGAVGVSSADLDGDGDLDLLGTAAFGKEIAWFDNTAGDASAWTKHTVDGAFDGAWSVSSADVDGDGDLDLLGTAVNASDVAWFENTAGDASAWTQHTVDGAFGGAISVSAADVDGDGDVDLLGAAYSANDVAWFENTVGDGSAWTQHTVADTFSAASLVSPADVDGDGDVDILGAAFDDDDVTWFENTAGDGSTWTEHTIADSFDGANWVSSADMDGDGDEDILGAAARGNEIAWWENTAGDGSAWAQHIVAAAFAGAYSVSAADVDGDGDVDVLGAAFLAEEIAWWENQGGQFALPTADLASARVTGGSTVPALEVDATHRGRAGDAGIELVTFELLLEDRTGTPLDDAQADNQLAALDVYLDDGSGSFESETDTLVQSLTSFSLTAGVLAVPFADGDPNVAISAMSSKKYFVVLSFEATASTASPDDIQITLRTTSSTGEDADHGLPIVLEYSAETPSTAIEVNDPPMAVGDAVAGLEDAAIAGNVLDGTSGGVDRDEELDLLTAVLVAGPSSGTLVGGLAANGDFIYQPNADFAGVDAFIYAANDGFETGNAATVTIVVTQVNDAPSFSLAPSVSVERDLGPQSLPGVASAISPGPPSEAAQAVAFTVTGNTDPGLFSTGPVLSNDGTLSFASAPGAVGTATVTVLLMDDGGIANGGVDTSASQNFDIEVVDSVAPQVVGVAAASGEPIEACAALREPTSSLDLTFSESMADPPGDVGANDVTNPANYLLVATGPDGDFATVSCAGGPEGDDLLVAIDQVVWDGASLATVQLASPLLDQELHQFFACATLTDPMGNALDGDGAGGPSDDFVRPFRVDLGNAFVNGHFDHCGAPPASLDAWTVDLDAPSFADAEGDDAIDAPLSAAADLTGLSVASDPLQITLSQCVDASPDTEYAYSLVVRQGPEDVAVDATGFCFYFAGEACTGTAVGSDFVATRLTGTAGGFVDMAGTLVSPSGAHSGLCGFDVMSDGEPLFEVTVDDLSLVIAPLFVDGFESGDTSAWSMTEP